MSWHKQAACLGMETSSFFEDPETGRNRRAGTLRVLRQTCAGCPVKIECLEHALTYPEHYGFWGGATEEERRLLRNRRARARSRS